MKPLVVLWVGGGQDSTALLYKFAFDSEFRQKYLQNDASLIAVMADTGNEFPDTYTHIESLKRFSLQHGIEFYFITPDMGYHGDTWQSLQAQMERNSNIFSVALPKSCTDNLKIKVCYRFLQEYVKKKYQFESEGKRVFYEYEKHFGKLVSIIGFAKGEESRVAANLDCELFPEFVTDSRPKWMQRNIQNCHPLIDMRWNRADCQQYIGSLNLKVPMPSNCMMCPFQNEAEIVYLYRFHNEMWQYWIGREKAKLEKNQFKARNLGVKGEKTLEEFLGIALEKYGSWTDQQLIDYRFTHGHCVKSKY